MSSNPWLQDLEEAGCTDGNVADSEGDLLLLAAQEILLPDAAGDASSAVTGDGGQQQAENNDMGFDLELSTIEEQPELGYQGRNSPICLNSDFFFDNF
jgi:hypothetical protein